MVLLWKGKLTNQNQSLYESQNTGNPRRKLLIPQYLWFFGKTMAINQREIEIERSSSKIMTDFEWKVENWRIHQINLRKSTHRAHTRNFKKRVYSRVYPYTHALFFKIFIVNTKYLQLVWGQPWHDSAKPGCPKPYIVRRNMFSACF